MNEKTKQILRGAFAGEAPKREAQGPFTEKAVAEEDGKRKPQEL